MKKIIKLFIIVGFMLFSNFIALDVNAQENFGDFPYEGTYLTIQNDTIRGYHFNHENQTITIYTQYAENGYAYLNQIINSGSYLLDPSTTSEEIAEFRDKWGIDEVDLSEVLHLAADQVEPWMNKTDVMKLVYQYIPGIHVIQDINSNRVGEVLLVNAKIEASQSVWRVSLLGNDRLLRFEMTEDASQLIDDRGIIYEKVEDEELEI
ncbi:hypothetical protein ACTQ54_03445 [Fundicoccus sp. Sow4_H7]|uniref:hypothetical protein n=1 Tax=Fundicoccus sp. Sow4_H7 TaxID=3438784 RepID=UPI003F8F75D1